MSLPDLSHTPELRQDGKPRLYRLGDNNLFPRLAQLCTECGHFYDPKISKVCVSKLAKATVL